MTKLRLLAFLLCLSPAVVLSQSGQGVNSSDLLKPLGDSWPTYSGDYSGKRFSSLTQVNQSNVKNLTLAWTLRLPGGPGNPNAIPVPGVAPVYTGGLGTTDFTTVNIKGSILMVDEVLYVSAPDHVWAVDARDGRILWRFFWRTRGGTHIGNRGLGMWNNYLFLETPDNYLVSLDARTGRERWHKEIASFDEQYFSTPAPIVVDNHVLVGTGNDLDAPGFLQSFDPETGDLQWKFYTVPMKPGDPGLNTWKDLDAARHGGGQVWVPGSYDPESHLYIFGTGNPTPAYTATPRGEGDNLFTCSIIAVNVDTGKMVWYYQTSPHDTHDWDSGQTPILADMPINGNFASSSSPQAATVTTSLSID
jgi:alcohol dehydrogenase (cytochrome c)